MTTSDPIESLLSAYAAAVRAKDVGAFLACYSPDAVVFDAWDRWEYRGGEAWRRVIEGWFASLGMETVHVGVKELASWEAAGLASGHAILEFAAFDGKGKRLRSLENRVTLVARETEDGWKIVHQHTSIPVAFSTRPAVPRPAAQ